MSANATHEHEGTEFLALYILRSDPEEPNHVLDSIREGLVTDSVLIDPETTNDRVVNVILCRICGCLFIKQR